MNEEEWASYGKKVNATPRYEFKCNKCGKEGNTVPFVPRAGTESTLLCKNCFKQKHDNSQY